MKKLSVIFMLVLGMASIANAVPYFGGLGFTVNGEAQPDVITLRPSEAVVLDLELLDGFTTPGYTIDYQLTNAQAEFIIDGYQDAFGHVFEPIAFPTVFDLPGGVIPINPQWVRITGTQVQSDPVAGQALLMESLVIHCLDTTPVTLEIIAAAGLVINGEAIDAGTVIHTLGIVQIPEPMTIALLGLGGLFLRRRK